MKSPRLAYYAHHHGSGHIRNGLQVARSTGLPTLLMSSANVSQTPPNVDYEQLTSDVIDDHIEPELSPFHYTPTGSLLRRRSHEIDRALDAFHPDLVICDVSVEVAIRVRLAGYVTLYRRMHGDRNDPAHRLAYSACNGMIAYFPEEMELSDFPNEYRAKTHYVGMPETGTVAANHPVRSKTVVVLTSLGGTGVATGDVNRAARQSPDWQWQIVGLTSGSEPPETNVELVGRVDDPWPYLCSATVIVTSSGYNAIRTTASANRPMVLVPEARPFLEQQRLAEAMQTATGVEVLRTWGDSDWARRLSTLEATTARTSEVLITASDFGEHCLAAFDEALSAG